MAEVDLVEKVRAGFVARLNAQRGAEQSYLASGQWTPIAAAALCGVAKELFPQCTAVARKCPDSYGRSEYLAADVMAYDDGVWGRPYFVAEHENVAERRRIQYNAWKLLSIDAECRVFVGYFGGPDKHVSDFDALCDAVREVVEGHRRDKAIITIAAPWKARPVAGAFSSLYQARLCRPT